MKKYFFGITIIISTIPLISLFYIYPRSFVYLSVTFSIIFFVVAHFIFERNKIHGLIHYLFNCVFTGLSIYLSLTNNVVTGIGTKIGPTYWLHSGIFLSLSTLMSGTYLFLEKFRKPLSLINRDTGGINLELITANFENINKRLEKIEEEIAQATQVTNEEVVRKGKNLDCVLGFVLGIISSVLINFLVRLLIK
jgi:tetrahydromethanopterin S-methyltransferase subunit G